jgi:hypothetical protein
MPRGSWIRWATIEVKYLSESKVFFNVYRTIQTYRLIYGVPYKRGKNRGLDFTLRYSDTLLVNLFQHENRKRYVVYRKVKYICRISETIT